MNGCNFVKVSSPASRKLRLPQVTLLCVDTSRNMDLSERALRKSMEEVDFGAVRFLTTDATRRHSVKIPNLNGLDAYSNFVVRELHKYFDTSHCLLVQWDGYVLNPAAWQPSFMDQDYIGAPWLQWMIVGNGGFSLRSKKLCQRLSTFHPGENAHPEDAWICYRHRNELLGQGFKFATPAMALRFSFEGRSYDGKEWRGSPTAWSGQFGFHSYLSVLPGIADRPLVFHHSGDAGDVVYSMAAAKAMGGGVYFFSDNNRYPYPRPCRCRVTPEWVSNLAPLFGHQDYVWNATFTHGTPFSAQVDFNAFREFYRTNRVENWESLFRLQQRAFGVSYPENEPWLSCPNPERVEGRPIVVSRSARYHNDRFPWHALVQKYGDQMVFVGEESEWRIFQGFSPNKEIPWKQTPNLYELARVIAGSKAFIGNQNCSMAVALGIGANIIQECWLGNPNCVLKRDNAIYFKHDQPLSIPDSWLKG